MDSNKCIYNSNVSFFIGQYVLLFESVLMHCIAGGIIIVSSGFHYFQGNLLRNEVSKKAETDAQQK
jgi:hypothetical protein